MSNDKPFRGRLLLVGAVTGLALSVGGVAYAVSGDPGSGTEYVQIVDGSGDRAAERAADGDRDNSVDSDGWDCPEKRGDGQGSGSDAADARNATDQL